MKKDCLRHPKVFDLASRLGISRPAALGYLTLLWDFTEDSAPQGNIGKWSNGAIARACDWSGNSDEFLDALIASGWLDQSVPNRLLIHDWEAHCQGWVRNKLAKVGLDFITDSPTDPITDSPTDPITDSPTDSPTDRETHIAKRASGYPTSRAPTKPSHASGLAVPSHANPDQGICAASGETKKRFRPPTVEEVTAYCQERANQIDPAQFVDHYQANGWMRGKTKLRDWQAAVRTWERSQRPAGNGNDPRGNEAAVKQYLREEGLLDGCGNQT